MKAFIRNLGGLVVQGVWACACMCICVVAAWYAWQHTPVLVCMYLFVVLFDILSHQGYCIWQQTTSFIHITLFSLTRMFFPFFFFTFSFIPLPPSPQKRTNKCRLHCPFWQVIVRKDSWFCCDIPCIWTHLQYQWKSGDQYIGKQKRVWSNVINAIRYASRTWGHSGIDCFL